MAGDARLDGIDGVDFGEDFPALVSQAGPDFLELRGFDDPGPPCFTVEPFHDEARPQAVFRGEHVKNLGFGDANGLRDLHQFRFDNQPGPRWIGIRRLSARGSTHGEGLLFAVCNDIDAIGFLTRAAAESFQTRQGFESVDPASEDRFKYLAQILKVFNQDNVLLVDVRKAPIERITPKGIKTSDAEYELDVIIFATGYDAVTGALNKIEIRGEGGQTLKDKFAQGPRTYMGISSAGFPNLFTVNSASVGNFVRACEPLVEWVTEAICYVRENEFTRISATPEAEEAWGSPKTLVSPSTNVGSNRSRPWT